MVYIFKNNKYQNIAPEGKNYIFSRLHIPCLSEYIIITIYLFKIIHFDLYISQASRHYVFYLFR
jgi:hypothetical protein